MKKDGDKNEVVAEEKSTNEVTELVPTNDVQGSNKTSAKKEKKEKKDKKVKKEKKEKNEKKDEGKEKKSKKETSKVDSV